MTWQEQQDAIKAAAARFPQTFGLRAFPGKVFRVSLRSSYFSGDTLMLYTEVQDGDRWLSFCKGAPAELAAEVTR